MFSIASGPGHGSMELAHTGRDLVIERSKQRIDGRIRSKSEAALLIELLQRRIETARTPKPGIHGA
jgi:hypothetical protein